jgi:DNA-binding NarL/FixJ family response regulator
MITLMLIDEDTLFCEGLEKALRPAIRLMGEAASGGRGLALLRQTRPDIVLLNAQLPDMSGERLCRTIHRQWPYLRMIFIFSAAHLPTLSRLVALPAQGFLTKEACYRSLDAFKTIHVGRTYLQPELALGLLRYRSDRLILRLDHLSAREYEVLVLLARGKIYEEVAELMHLSIKTIYNLKMAAFKKLALSSQDNWRSWVLPGCSQTGDLVIS